MFQSIVYDLIIVHKNLINLNLSIFSLPCVFIVDCVPQINAKKMEGAGRLDLSNPYILALWIYRGL